MAVPILPLLILTLALSPLSLATSSPNDTPTPRNDAELRDVYAQWMAKHNRAHNGLEEEERRFQIFKDNARFVDEHNHGTGPDRTYRLGLTRFADMTNEEYRREFLGTRSDPRRRIAKARAHAAGRRYVSRAAVDGALPDAVDWRLNGAVNSVKNQGTCG